jgi:2-keto-4-pentenoate hydratase/2-oxohepta-3-ene-1,7-dioic acid hydratase in catechol pathway
MKIATFETEEYKKVGVFVNGNLIDIDLLSEVLSHVLDKEFPAIFTLVDAIQEFDSIKKMIAKGKSTFKDLFETLFAVKNPKLSTPIDKYNKIICLGKNYVEHAKETGSKPPEEPIIFGKFADCVIATQNDIEYPKWAKRLDPEVELAIIIEKTASNVPVSKAMDYVFGYTISNDLTERNLQHEDVSRGYPWLRSKNFDNSMPLGPWIVTKDEIKDPHHLDIELSVNDNVRQKGNTKDMIFKIDYLVSYISKYMTLNPGDIISTGTVAGIAPIKKGDKVICKLEKIGELINRII